MNTETAQSLPDFMNNDHPESADPIAAHPELVLPQVIVVNDLSGFGRCSIAVQLPIISILKAECLLLPTALLSNHTAYPSFYVHDLSADLDPWIAQWQNLPIHPQAILTGYLGNAGQARQLLKLADLFAGEDCLLIVDPVMGDDGVKYSSITDEHLQSMKILAQKADVITPNITEACLLANLPWQESWKQSDLEELIGKLKACGYPKQMIITGVRLSDRRLGDVIVNGDSVKYRFFKQEYPSRSGTGDLFSAIICGALVQNDSLERAVARAQDFIQAALKATQQYNVPKEEGCVFEVVLGRLLDDHLKFPKSQNALG